jgi:hypothetical protein
LQHIRHEHYLKAKTGLHHEYEQAIRTDNGPRPPARHTKSKNGKRNKKPPIYDENGRRM